MTEQQHSTPRPGAERRSSPRYRLAAPLTGFIEHQFKRYPGRVLDLSMTGFRLYVPRLTTALRGPDNFDFGEVVWDTVAVGGFGRIVFSRAEHVGVTLGFEWDAAMAKESALTLNVLVQDLVRQRKAGWVTRTGGIVQVGGHISAALADDLFTAVREGALRISLAHAASLDPGGLDMLLSLQEAGIGFVDAHSDLQNVLERFRLWPTLTPQSR